MPFQIITSAGQGRVQGLPMHACHQPVAAAGQKNHVEELAHRWQEQLAAAHGHQRFPQKLTSQRSRAQKNQLKVILDLVFFLELFTRRFHAE
jgi:hypothetical protein